jgi:uncharacterized protein (DUF3820 family)
MSQNTIMPFGKYKNRDLLFIAEMDPNYLLWLQTTAKGKLLEDVNSFVKTDYFKDCLREEQESKTFSEDLWDR